MTVTCDAPKCDGRVQYECVCRRCASEPTAEERFHCCLRHPREASSQHEIIRERPANWGLYHAAYPPLEDKLDKAIGSPSLYGHAVRLHELEPYYSRHVQAMTAEGLHSKSDIAAELAFRDQVIEAAEATHDDEEAAHGETLALLAAREALLDKCLEALIWCSGSNDFQSGGVAFLGWHEMCRPLIAEVQRVFSHRAASEKLDRATGSLRTMTDELMADLTPKERALVMARRAKRSET